ncbi:hypothetical protein ACVW0P_001429 [Mucilaginibacter sp. UYNi724]
MTLDEAKKMLADNEHLIGRKYKGKEISNIILMEKDADLLAIGQVARQLLQHGEYWPNQQHKEYELFVLYDLPNWLDSQPLEYGTLKSLLIHWGKK